jgi:hypothetical protein
MVFANTAELAAWSTETERPQEVLSRASLQLVSVRLQGVINRSSCSLMINALACGHVCAMQFDTS